MPVKLISPGGGSVVIAPASTSSNYTLTVPAATANVVTTGDSNTITQTMMNTGFYAGYGPAFLAYPSTNQTGVTGGVYTKITLNATQYDTANCFNTSTYRFTPNVAGYYLISWAIDIAPSVSSAMTGWASYATIGSTNFWGSYGAAFSQSNEVIAVGSSIAYLNGTGNYVELYARGTVTSGTVTFYAGPAYTYLAGCLIRAV